MTTPWEKQIDRLMADYQRHRTDALEVGEHMRSITGTATLEVAEHENILSANS